MVAFLIPLIVAVAVNVASYLIMPKPKSPKPPAVEDAQAPTADAGKPIPVIFGEITVKGVNVLWYGEVSSTQFQIKV